MDRSKGRIAAVMLSALACSSASKADTRALSTAGKILTALGVVVGATEIYNEVSAVVRKKQGKELNWWNGEFSVYNRFFNSEKKSEKKQTIKLDDKLRSGINVVLDLFKEKVGFIDNLKQFFANEMVLGDYPEAMKDYEDLKKIFSSELKGNWNAVSNAVTIQLGENGKFFSMEYDVGTQEVNVKCNEKLMLKKK